ELYDGREPIFDGYGIEQEIDRALERQVTLKSGGSLIFDQGEALTAIDVNTGKIVGVKGKTLEETITQTNLEAADELAAQLKPRTAPAMRSRAIRTPRSPISCAAPRHRRSTRP